MIAPNSSTPSQRAFEIVLEVILNLMMPLFIGGSTHNRDPDLARSAAIEMLTCFRARDAWELLAGAQISGFGLAALGSIGLALQPGLPLPLNLRLRANANTLQRSGNEARKALDAYRINYPDAGPTELTPEMAENLANSVLEARRLSAEAAAVLYGPAHAPNPTSAQASAETRSEPPVRAAPPQGPAQVQSRAPDPARAQTSAATSVGPAAGAPTQAPIGTAFAESARSTVPTPNHVIPGNPHTGAAGPQAHGHVQGHVPGRAQPQPAPTQEQAPRQTLTATAAPAEAPKTMMTDAERRYRASFALGFAKVSQEMAAEMEHLPPSARAEQQIKISALSTASRQMLSDAPLVPWHQSLSEISAVRPPAPGAGKSGPTRHSAS